MVSFYVSTTFVEVNHCRQALNEVMAFASPFLKNEELATAEKKKQKKKRVGLHWARCAYKEARMCHLLTSSPKFILWLSFRN